jgi:tRNA 2-selenouridine synthase
VGFWYANFSLLTLYLLPMIKPINLSDLLLLKEPIPLTDVRTPAEFEQGCVPGAFNLPIFSNEERIKVGTTYKQIGREEAILLGFDLTGPKWSGFIKQALEVAPDKRIAVHCWRGGMRSGAMAWALNLYGFEVYVVNGGYKSYRRWVLSQFEQSYNLSVLGGMTGSGKTRILSQLRKLGEQVIDLEDLAQHQGSSYGTLNKMVQPTQEQFENNFASELSRLNKDRRTWVEDESLTIGKRSIPNAFWHQMREAVLIDLKVDHSQRVADLTAEYGILDKKFLITCTERIQKRLGPEQTKNAIVAINEGRMADFIKLVLVYYDKTYRAGLAKRSAGQVIPIIAATTDVKEIALQLKTFINTDSVEETI